MRKSVDMPPYTMVVYSVVFACLLSCALLLRLSATGMKSVIGGVVVLAGVGWYMTGEWRRGHASAQSDEGARPAHAGPL